MLYATSPAKINLGLHILHRRSDGYHDLSTVFHPIGWADTLTVDYADTISLVCTDASLPDGDDNLVIRAAKLLKSVAQTDQGARLHLKKEIPRGAGLGGGSSNAAIALQLLCRLWKLDHSMLPMDSLALELGSDVPFFMQKYTAYAQGRGEKLTPLYDYSFPFSLAVIVHPIHISTAWAFQRVGISEMDTDLIALIQSNDLTRWSNELINDFEEVIFSHWPVLRQTKSFLLRQGAGFASLTGSGAGIYGIFDRYKDAQEAALEAASKGCSTWCQGP